MYDSSKMWTVGCETACDAVSGNNGRSTNDDGKIFFA